MLEFLMPVVVLAWLTLVLRNTGIYIYASFAMELVVVLGIVLGVMLNVRVKRAVREKFGDSEVRGTGFYAFSRAAMPRFLRQPRPAITFTGKPK
jgi:membrane protein implicated in regulation of membrane protease activity